MNRRINQVLLKIQAKSSLSCRHNSIETLFVPKCNPLKHDDLERIKEFIHRAQRIFVLSGAGISTESG
jgi:hypothetical protein